MSGPRAGLYFALGVLAVAVVVWLWRLLRTRPRDIISRIVRTPIANAEDGAKVKVVGEVRFLDETFEAPLSGRRCALFQARVEYDHRPQRRNMLTAAEGRRIAEFLIDDGTTAARVDPAEADLDLLDRAERLRS